MRVTTPYIFAAAHPGQCPELDQVRYACLCYTDRRGEEKPVEPADSQIRKHISRTDIVVAGITAVVLLITTAWLVILLF